MDTSIKRQANHIGRKISRIRELRGVKQDVLALELGISQQADSKLEQSENIDEEVLERIAKALGVSPEAIKNYNDEAVIHIIQNNYEGSNTGASNLINYHCTFNPLDKLMEAYEENRKLYERLLAVEREKLELVKGNNTSRT